VTRATIEVLPIDAADVVDVARFLHAELNESVSAAAWMQLLQPPWGATGPNRGFQLRADGELVGVYAAVYAERMVEGAPVSICNLAAFCVRAEHRMHGLKLVRALLKQRDQAFTDFSPSGNVVAMNERLGFRRLDTSTRLVVNLPRWPRRDIRLSDSPARLQSVLQGTDAQIYRDHRESGAARHLLIERADEYAYLVFRADARKGLRLFAAPLYVGGDPAVLGTAWNDVRAYLLRRHRLLFCLAEHRLLPAARGLGRELRHPRPKMVRGDTPDAIDYLYSELALVSW